MAVVIINIIHTNIRIVSPTITTVICTTPTKTTKTSTIIICITAIIIIIIIITTALFLVFVRVKQYVLSIYLSIYLFNHPYATKCYQLYPKETEKKKKTFRVIIENQASAIYIQKM